MIELGISALMLDYNNIDLLNYCNSLHWAKIPFFGLQVSCDRKICRNAFSTELPYQLVCLRGDTPSQNPPHSLPLALTPGTRHLCPPPKPGAHSLL